MIMMLHFYSEVNSRVFSSPRRILRQLVPYVRPSVHLLVQQLLVTRATSSTHLHRYTSPIAKTGFTHHFRANAAQFDCPGDARHFFHPPPSLHFSHRQNGFHTTRLNSTDRNCRRCRRSQFHFGSRKSCTVLSVTCNVLELSLRQHIAIESNQNQL